MFRKFHRKQKKKKTLFMPNTFHRKSYGFHDKRKFYAASCHNSKTAGRTFIRLHATGLQKFAEKSQNFIKIGAIEII